MKERKTEASALRSEDQTEERPPHGHPGESDSKEEHSRESEEERTLRVVEEGVVLRLEEVVCSESSNRSQAADGRAEKGVERALRSRLEPLSVGRRIIVR